MIKRSLCGLVAASLATSTVLAQPITLICSGTLRSWVKDELEGAMKDIAVEIDLTKYLVKGIPLYDDLNVVKVTDAEIYFGGSYTLRADGTEVTAQGTISRASGRLIFYVRPEKSSKILVLYELHCEPFKKLI